MGFPWEWGRTDGNGREWECCNPFPHISSSVYININDKQQRMAPCRYRRNGCLRPVQTPSVCVLYSCAPHGQVCPTSSPSPRLHSLRPTWRRCSSLPAHCNQSHSQYSTEARCGVVVTTPLRHGVAWWSLLHSGTAWRGGHYSIEARRGMVVTTPLRHGVAWWSLLHRGMVWRGGHYSTEARCGVVVTTPLRHGVAWWSLLH